MWTGRGCRLVDWCRRSCDQGPESGSWQVNVGQNELFRPKRTAPDIAEDRSRLGLYYRSCHYTYETKDSTLPVTTMPGLRYHDWLLLTLHGIRIYLDRRTDEIVCYGVEEAHPHHLQFARDRLAGRDVDIQDYAGPLMSKEDLKVLIFMDFGRLLEREQEELA